jgi:hypothetical protein
MSPTRGGNGRTRAEQAFLQDARKRISEYLAREGVPHGGVPEEPEWFVHPVVAVWAVASGRVQGSVGWFAVAGDLPTDYVSSADVADARAALRAFAHRWAGLARTMRARVSDPDLSAGSPEDWPRTSELLERGARLLASYAADDGHWR